MHSKKHTMSYKHSSATGLTISIGGVEVDIFVAQRTIARLLRGIQKTQLLRISRTFGHWKNWDQYERIKQRTDVMVATKQLEHFSSSSLQEVRDMIGCDRATFFMVNPETHDLWSAKADGHENSFRVPRGSGVAGATVESKIPSNVIDAYRDPRFNSSFDKLSGYKTNTILCYPVFEIIQDTDDDDSMGEVFESSTNVIACVQLVNKHGGVFTHGDEDTCEMLCTYLARALSMSDDQTDFSKLRRKFDAWSIAQRKQLMMDRAYGSVIEMFLEQACLLTGAEGSRFVLRQQAAVTSSSQRSVLHEWRGTCQYSTVITNKTVVQSVKRAWSEKEAFLLADHIDGFSFDIQDRESRGRSNSDDPLGLESVIVIPLFLNSDDSRSSGSTGEAKVKEGSGHTEKLFPSEELAALREQFDSADDDGSGTIDIAELGAICSSLGEDLSRKQLEALIKDVDTNADGTVDWHEFLLAMHSKVPRVKRRVYDTDRSVCVLEYKRRAPGSEDSTSFAKRTSKIVSKLFLKFGKILFDRTHVSDSKLADIRNWVRVQMQKQARARFQKLDVGPMSRKNESLSRTAATLERQNVELRKQLKRTDHMLKSSKENQAFCKAEVANMKVQRDIMAEQLIAVTPSSPQVSVDKVEKLSKKFRRDIHERDEEIKKLKLASLHDQKLNEETSRALEAAVNSIADLEERKKKDHAQLMGERKRKTLREEHLRSYLTHVVQTLKNADPDHESIFTENVKGQTNMVDVTDLRELLLQTVEAVLGHDEKTHESVKILASKLSLKLSAAETQLSFLPKCQKMLTESKRTLATMQVKEQSRARQRDEAPFETSIAIRHYTLKFFSTWRTRAHMKASDRAKHSEKILACAVTRSLRRSMMRRSFTNWIFFVDAAIEDAAEERSRLNRTKKAMLYFTRGALVRAMNTWRSTTNTQRSNRRKMAKAVRCMQRRFLENGMQRMKLFSERRTSARKLVRRIAAKKTKTEMSGALRVWNRASMEKDRDEQEHTLVRHQTLSIRFRQWAQRVEGLRNEKRLLRRALSRITHRRLVFRWNIWLVYVDTRQGQRKRVLRMLTNTQRYQCGRAWRKWISCMELFDRETARAHKIMKRWLQTSVLRSFNQWIEFTDESIRQKQLLRRALARITQRKVSACFLAWKENNQSMRGFRQLLLRILVRWDRKKEAYAIRQWAYFATLKRKQEAVAQRVLSRWFQESKLRVFNAWRVNAANHKVERQLVKRAVARFTQRHTAACFNSWRDAIEDLIEARSLLHRILTRWDRKQEAYAIRQWAYFASVRKKQDLIAQRVLKRWLEESLLRSFNRWVDRAQELKVERQLIRRVANRLRNRKVAACFSGWKHAVDQLAVERQIARKALSRFVHSTMSRCFLKWHTVAQDLALARSKTWRILVRWDRKCEVRAFRIWADTVRVLARQDAVIERILLRWKNGLLHRMFNKWCAMARKNRTDRQLATRAQSKFIHRTVSLTFATWRSNMADVQGARKKVIRILKRWDRKKEVQAFQKWVSFSHLAARQQSVAERIMWRWSHMTIVRVFHQWQVSVRHQVLRRNLEKRANEIFYRKVTHTSFSGWQQVTRDWCRIRTLLIQIVCHHDLMSVKVRFAYWKNQSELWNVQKDALHRHGLYRYMVRLKRLAMQRWILADRMKVWGKEVKCQTFERLKRSKLLRQMFSNWLLFDKLKKVTRKRFAVIGFRADVKIRKRQLKSAMRSWSHVTADCKRRKANIQTLLGSLLRSTKRRLASRAWQRWKLSSCGLQATQEYVADSIMSVSMDHRRNTTLLRRCWSIWSAGAKLSVYKKRAAKHTVFHCWNVQVRRGWYERHEKLTDRFHNAGLRGSQAEVQWALGKWQQFAFCMQIRKVADLERRVFLKSIRAENRKLKSMLLEYHRRGMFVLEGSKDYLVQRKIHPSLTINDYQDANSMIAQSYHGEMPAGVVLNHPSNSVFGAHGERSCPPVPPTQPGFVLGLLTTPSRRIGGFGGSGSDSKE